MQHKLTTVATVVLLAAIVSMLYVSAPHTKGLQLVKRWLCAYGTLPANRAPNGQLTFWAYDDWCSIYYDPYSGLYKEWVDAYYWYSFWGPNGPWTYCCQQSAFLGYVNGVNV